MTEYKFNSEWETVTPYKLITAIDLMKVEGSTSVYFDFGNLALTKIDSWRGDYSEMAIGYSMDRKHMAAWEFRNMLEGCENKVYTGYKGGEFTMSMNTPIHVDNYGECTDTEITGLGIYYNDLLIQTQRI